MWEVFSGHLVRPNPATHTPPREAPWSLNGWLGAERHLGEKGLQVTGRRWEGGGRGRGGLRQTANGLCESAVSRGLARARASRVAGARWVGYFISILFWRVEAGLFYVGIAAGPSRWR